LKVEFSNHAKEKISVLPSHGTKISERQIREVVMHPQMILNAWEGRLIAQKDIDESHILRVVYMKEKQNEIRVITVYPARKGRY
jgi:uncharacterized DUF497 family protein